MGRARVDQRPGQKKVKDPNKPKRATSAYFFFLADCREQAKKAGRSLSKIAEFTKECSETWREMGPKDKKKFDEKASTDKKRYEAEMKNYGGGGGSAKAQRDPNQPKKPLTGYFLFLADFRKQNEGTPNKDILKMAGEKWRGLDETEKLPYEQASQKEQKKYEIAMAEFRKTGGVKANGGAKAAAPPAASEEEDDDDMEDDDEEEESDE